MARRAPYGKAPPTWIGGCGFCTGLGRAMIGSKWTNSPWYSASDFVQISFIASMDSRIARSGSHRWSRGFPFRPGSDLRRRRTGTVPGHSVDRGDQLGGLDRVALLHQRSTPVPSLMVLVTWLAAASTTNGSIAS